MTYVLATILVVMCAANICACHPRRALIGVMLSIVALVLIALMLFGVLTR